MALDPWTQSRINRSRTCYDDEEQFGRWIMDECGGAWSAAQRSMWLLVLDAIEGFDVRRGSWRVLGRA